MISTLRRTGSLFAAVTTLVASSEREVQAGEGLALEVPIRAHEESASQYEQDRFERALSSASDLLARVRVIYTGLMEREYELQGDIAVERFRARYSELDENHQQLYRKLERGVSKADVEKLDLLHANLRGFYDGLAVFRDYPEARERLVQRLTRYRKEYPEHESRYQEVEALLNKADECFQRGETEGLKHSIRSGYQRMPEPDLWQDLGALSIIAVLGAGALWASARVSEKITESLK